MALNRKGPMMVLACWQTPAAIRHAGVDLITALLRRGHVKNAAHVAEAMVVAPSTAAANGRAGQPAHLTPMAFESGHSLGAGAAARGGWCDG